MDYQKIYNQLIQRGKNRSLDGYYESHHIVPKCLGGDNHNDNLVKLTPEEHYVAHQLLIKIYPGVHALIKAAQMMVPNRPSNKLYGWLKRKYAKVQSEAQSGVNNSQFGTRWVCNLDQHRCMKISKNDPLPPGWIEGRRIKFRSEIEIKQLITERKIKHQNRRKKNTVYKKRKTKTGEQATIKMERERKRSEQEHAHKQEALYLFNKLKSGEFSSIRALSKSKYWNKSSVSLMKFFKKYIPDYCSHVSERQQKFRKVN